MLGLGLVALMEGGVVSFDASCVGEKGRRVLFVMRERPGAWRRQMSRDALVALGWLT